MGRRALRRAGDVPPALAGLQRLGEEIERLEQVPTARTGAAAPGVARQRRHRNWRRRVLTGAVSLVALVVVLAVSAYGYIRYEWDKIPSHACPSCADAGSGPYNVLLVGSDSRAGDTGAAAQAFGSATQVTGQRADTIKIVHVDPAAGTARILSIPRDTFVTLSGVSPASGLSSRNKINAAYNDGPDSLIQTIHNTFGIEISDYVTIDFAGLSNAVDALGGISMDFPYPVRDDDNGNNNSGLNIPRTGCQTIDGAQALALARSRYFQYYADGYWHSDPTSDIGRIERQNLIIEAMGDKAKSTLNPFTINSFLSAIGPHMSRDDNLSIGKMRALLQQYHAFSGQVPTYLLPTVPATTSAGDALIVQEPQAQEMIATFLGGPPDPVTTPPLAADGLPMSVPSAGSSASGSGSVPGAQAAATGGSAAPTTGGTGATTTTVAPSRPTSFDPVPC